jgi:hypothetical protein
VEGVDEEEEWGEEGEEEWESIVDQYPPWRGG